MKEPIWKREHWAAVDWFIEIVDGGITLGVIGGILYLGFKAIISLHWPW